MFKLYKKYLAKYKKHVILGPLFKLLEAIFELLVPLVITNMIDNGINNNELTSSEKIHFILINGAVLFVFAIVGLCSTLVCQFFASRASQGVGTALRDDLYEHINTLSFKELDYLQASSLITRMTADINNVQQSVAMLIRLVVRAPFIVIGATVFSFLVSWQAGLIFLITGILLFTLIFGIMFYTIPNNKLAQKSLDNVTTITKENLTGNRVVRAFSKQAYEFKRFVDSSEKLKDIQVRVSKMNSLLSPLTFVLVNIASILVLYVGGINFMNGKMTQGNIQALVNYFTQIQIAIVVVTNLVVIFTKASASAGRINEVFMIKPSIVYGMKEEGKDDSILMEFDHVSFTYNEGAMPSINDISFKIKKGDTIGVIGSTGSGKSTLVYLMNRFYDPNEGKVMLNGLDIKEYKKEYIASNIATVLQKNVLFSGTIRENLKYGKPDATDDEIYEALKNAQAYEFVSKMDDGLDHMILQGGKNLSGGQRQRLCIARALIKNSNLLILDDSSSALDFKTELNLRNSIKALNQTTLIISQRASSIMHADLILVLDKGYLTGAGTHEELLKTNQIYQEICDSQDLKEAK